MKNQFNTNYFYKILVSSYKLKFYFIFILQLYMVPISQAQASKVCENYFSSRDLLESFTPEERRNLQTLVEKYSYALQQPHESIVDVKMQIEQDLISIRNLKKWNVSQIRIFQILFASLVEGFLENKKQEILQTSQQDKERKLLLSEQKKYHQENKKYSPLLKRYKTNSMQILLKEILKRYETEDVFEAWIKSITKGHGVSKKPSLLEVEFLFEMQTDKNQVDREGKNILFYASKAGDLKVVQLLIDLGVDVNNSRGAVHPMVGAFLTGRDEVVRLLLDRGVDIDSLDSYETSLLMLAVKSRVSRDTLIPSLLLDAGAKINWQNKSGNTALMFAANLVNVKIVQDLLEAGADANLKNLDGVTALYIVRHTKSPYQNESDKKGWKDDQKRIIKLLKKETPSLWKSILKKLKG